MKRKGFTLIELLAVIIVLAIIALIATPIIFNVIENAKIKSLENSCYGVIDAVRTKYAEGLLNSENGLVDLTGDVANLTIAGEHPYMGTWTIDNSKDSAERGIKIEGVKFASMKNYTCSNVDE
ncbi:MAG: prepilin-type N-terminal cleavage/methylation domain-containing protein, partial [Candidatus Faecisoma sp.]|nr:prepilin-type N-terminal cleavage/methylation domain-containing protein [Candidatus Faecisoma sp.]